jgi:hypothetical protein
MSLEDNAPTSANCGEATTSQAPPVPGGTQHWNVTGATTSAWPTLAGEGNLLAGSAAGRGEGQHRCPPAGSKEPNQEPTTADTELPPGHSQRLSSLVNGTPSPVRPRPATWQTPLRCHRGRTVHVWDLVQGVALASFVSESQITTLATTPSGICAVAGTSTGAVHLLELARAASTILK